MAIWHLFEKISPPSSPPTVKAPLVVPTIVVTPVLEEQKTAAYDDEDFFGHGSSLKAFEAISIVEVSAVDVLPTPPASPPADQTCNRTGLGITGVDVQVTQDYRDPLNEVDDLLEILGLSVEEEQDEVEDEVEQLLGAMEDQASKLVNKSKAQFLELSREWNAMKQREYLPAKREAKLIISESYAMEGYRKSWTWSSTPGTSDEPQREDMSRDDKLFSAIVLADAAGPACKAAFEAVERIHNLQTVALSKYATRLKDHKILPLATYRRYVRRVKRTEREMEGWMRKRESCKKILEVGGRLINVDADEKVPGSADSGYEE